MQKNIKVKFFSNEHKGKVLIYLISPCMSSRGDSAVLDYGWNGITSVLFPVTHTSLVSLNNHASQAVGESLLICFLQSRPLFGSHGDQKWQLLQTATTVPQLRVPTKRSSYPVLVPWSFAVHHHRFLLQHFEHFRWIGFVENMLEEGVLWSIFVLQCIQKKTRKITAL